MPRLTIFFFFNRTIFVSDTDLLHLLEFEQRVKNIVVVLGCSGFRIYFKTLFQAMFWPLEITGSQGKSETIETVIQ